MFGFGARARDARKIQRLSAALTRYVTEALRWKTALHGANKGAQRKSRQARMWREKAEELANELCTSQAQTDENSKLLRQTERTLHSVRGAGAEYVKLIEKQQTELTALEGKLATSRDANKQ